MVTEIGSEFGFEDGRDTAGNIDFHLSRKRSPNFGEAISVGWKPDLLNEVCSSGAIAFVREGEVGWELTPAGRGCSFEDLARSAITRRKVRVLVADLEQDLNDSCIWIRRQAEQQLLILNPEIKATTALLFLNRRRIAGFLDREILQRVIRKERSLSQNSVLRFIPGLAGWEIRSIRAIVAERIFAGGNMNKGADLAADLLLQQEELKKNKFLTGSNN